MELHVCIDCYTILMEESPSGESVEDYFEDRWGDDAYGHCWHYAGMCREYSRPVEYTGQMEKTEIDWGCDACRSRGRFDRYVVRAPAENATGLPGILHVEEIPADAEPSLESEVDPDTLPRD